MMLMIKIGIHRLTRETQQFLWTIALDYVLPSFIGKI